MKKYNTETITPKKNIRIIHSAFFANEGSGAPSDGLIEVMQKHYPNAKVNYQH